MKLFETFTVICTNKMPVSEYSKLKPKSEEKSLEDIETIDSTLSQSININYTSDAKIQSTNNEEILLKTLRIYGDFVKIFIGIVINSRLGADKWRDASRILFKMRMKSRILSNIQTNFIIKQYEDNDTMKDLKNVLKNIGMTIDDLRLLLQMKDYHIHVLIKVPLSLEEAIE